MTEIRAFLTRKWQKELDYRLKKELWAFAAIASPCASSTSCTTTRASGIASYGNEMWEFDATGLMARRYASINDAPIREDERRVHLAPPATGEPRCRDELYVAGLWRYPVKTLGRRAPPMTTLTTDGLPFDRIVQVHGPEGVRTSRRHYKLLGLRGPWATTVALSSMGTRGTAQRP